MPEQARLVCGSLRHGRGPTTCGTPADAAAYCFEHHRDLIERIRDGGIKVTRSNLALEIARYIGAEDVNAKAKAREAERVESYRQLTGRDLVADEREQALREVRAKLRF